ncbi:substrate-binding domain-containing protein [Kibdelosporangium philippinense]|uniref:Substrate-binding domain-containing protein n=1 Tax=Kibdelosporangium philippinense TaxID=211113 RepID=A0ABS8Z6M5_9PSEU|nr:substrate-binding domain-containing protein [Kibdelosporangium philippinense]MCE7003082.1 substrate-binding domain-containing protein [Kibdelosporangium philippinense]
MLGRRLLAPLAALVMLTACGTDQAAGPSAEKSLILATTTSTQDSGLLDELLPAFTAETGWQVKPLAVGSGQAIELGRRGEADVLLVHSPAAEEKFVAEGTAGQRRLVMHNDFVLVGPSADPAGIRGVPAAQAMQKIAAAQAGFVSRGDESGTHAREKQLWQQQPSGSWYRSTGQGMGATLRVASETSAYTLTDRATYLAQKSSLALEILNEGGKALLNIYHVIEMTKRAGERVQPDGAKAFADWMVAPRAQEMIGRFGVAQSGQPLFAADAGKDEASLGS